MSTTTAPNQWLVEALDACPVSVFILNTSGEIIYANDKAETLLELSKEMITSKSYNAPAWDVTYFDGDPFPEEELPFSAVMRTGKPVDGIEHAINWPDGRRKYLSINARPLNEDGTLNRGVICTAEDITILAKTRFRLKETRRTYRNLFENLIDEVHFWQIETDTDGEIIDGRLIDINPSALRAWRKQREEVIGRTSEEIFGTKAPSVFVPMVKKTVVTGKSTAFDCYFEPTDQHLSLSIIPLGDKYLTTGRDITEKIITNQNLVKAKERAEASNNLKTTFLQNMSHEIRTPLNGIVGFSQLITEDCSEEERIDYGKIIKRCSDQLLTVIENILDISVLELKDQETKIERFSINELLEDLLAIFMFSATEKNLHLETSLPLHSRDSFIYSDKMRIIKIMSNLIENALKYTDQGRVKFGYQISNKHLELFVSDSGIGIPEALQSRVFNRFSQGDKKEATKRGGLGLGLSVALENAHLLGGNISLVSEENVGTTFKVTLPLRSKP